MMVVARKNGVPLPGRVARTPVPRGALARAVGVMWLLGAAMACATTVTPPQQPAPLDVAALEASSAAAPTDVELMTRLGAAYQQAGRIDDARAVLNRAIAADPTFAGAYLYLGIIHEDRGEFAEARRLYQTYLANGGTRPMRTRIRDRLVLLERKELVAAVKQARADEANLTRQPPAPGTVAVFPFTVPTEDAELAPLRTALAELLITDLAQTSRLRVLERTRVQEMLDELALAERAVVDDATAARAGRILAAEQLVQGRVGRNVEVVRLTGAVARPGPDSLQRVNPVGVEAAMRRLFDLQTQFALDVYRALGVELTNAERDRIAQRPTRNLQALLAYGLGLEAWDRDDYSTAAQQFGAAVSRDGNFAPAVNYERIANSALAASSTSTSELSRLGATELEVVVIDWGAIEGIIPRAGGRDAASEALGREGIVTSGRTWLDIILRRN
jgi:tetratricopeptide (TPR) repeat protein